MSLFNNKRNEKVVIPLTFTQRVENILFRKNHKPRCLWLSRSCAVVTTVIAIKNNKPYILINKRGSGTPDFQGYWNLPCGYLDYNETTGEAGIREVWEECGFDIRSIDKSHIIHDYMEEPWDFKSVPDENKQNVTIHHGIVFNCDRLPSLSMENCEEGEVDETLWVLLKYYKNYDFAFNHYDRIEKFINKIGL